jgi:hypothetical protein
VLQRTESPDDSRRSAYVACGAHARARARTRARARARTSSEPLAAGREPTGVATNGPHRTTRAVPLVWENCTRRSRRAAKVGCGAWTYGAIGERAGCNVR